LGISALSYTWWCSVVKQLPKTAIPDDADVGVVLRFASRELPVIGANGLPFFSATQSRPISSNSGVVARSGLRLVQKKSSGRDRHSKNQLAELIRISLRMGGAHKKNRKALN
jgi:hypothetical protein